MNVYEIGPFELNADRLTLKAAGRSVCLGPKVVETLLALAEHPGEALSKRALLDRIWPEGFVEEANLSQNMYVLRKTFRSYGWDGAIETLPRFGYRLTAPVRCRVAAPERRFSRRIAVAFACAACILAFTALAVTSTWGSRAGTPRLSENGARLYEIGRYYWNLRTRTGVQNSLRYFAQVIDTDPNDSSGYAALAEANVTMGDYCYGTHRPALYFARAEQYAKKALMLDPNSAQAHAALGYLALRRRDSSIAIAELQRAIALDASDSSAHEWYGIALRESGKVSQALRELQEAVKLDPLSVAATAWLGSTAYASRRFDDAIAYSQQALELSPSRPDAVLTLARAYKAQGRNESAKAAFARYKRIGVMPQDHPKALENAARPAGSV